MEPQPTHPKRALQHDDSVPICHVDKQGRICEASAAFCELLKLTDEVCGDSFAERCVHHSCRKRLNEACVAVLESGMTQLLPGVEMLIQRRVPVLDLSKKGIKATGSPSKSRKTMKAAVCVYAWRDAQEMTVDDGAIVGLRLVVLGL